MIHAIYSNNSLFEQVNFNKGLNVIVGEKSEKSDKKGTRNGVGKTTLLRVIDFCLGSRGSGLPTEHLKGWNFTLEMDLFDEKIKVTRYIDNKNEIIIQGNIAKFPVNPKNIEDNTYFIYRLNDWKAILKKGLFNFEKNEKIKYNPKFRSLMHYFYRDGPESYTDPFKKFVREPPVQWQIANAFLLNLKWEDASEAQEIKDEAKLIRELKKLYSKHILKDLNGKTFLRSKGSLETEKIKLEEQVNKINSQLSEFKVNDQYKDIERNANKLSKDISKLSNEKFMLTEKLEQYKKSIKEESNIDSFNLEDVYNEINYHLGDSITKTLNDAQIFHGKIIRNRKKFLEAEIISIENQILEIENKIKENNSNLSRVMSILNSSIALDRYKLIIDENESDKKKLDEIKSKLNEMNSINKRANDLKIRKSEFEKIIERDYEESEPERKKAVHIFDKCALTLYGESGSLIIDADEKGYSFDIKIPKSGSDGVDKMKIFCYDLTLLEIHSKMNNINFLIHDNNIFYGVDERQVANGLQYINEKSRENNFQYICTLNSDKIPYNEFPTNFNMEDYIVRKLKDSDASETTLGFYF